MIISREDLEELTFEDVSLRGTRHRLRVVSQSSVCRWFGNWSMDIRTKQRFRAFFFFFSGERRDFDRETEGVEARSGEMGNNEKKMPLFLRRAFVVISSPETRVSSARHDSVIL